MYPVVSDRKKPQRIEFDTFRGGAEKEMQTFKDHLLHNMQGIIPDKVAPAVLLRPLLSLHFTTYLLLFSSSLHSPPHLVSLLFPHFEHLQVDIQLPVATSGHSVFKDVLRLFVSKALADGRKDDDESRVKGAAYATRHVQTSIRTTIDGLKETNKVCSCAVVTLTVYFLLLTSVASEVEEAHGYGRPLGFQAAPRSRRPWLR
eukprot:113329-Hanusia_phi.AAC.1